jgi:three-Cys-motif partner protein
MAASSAERDRVRPLSPTQECPVARNDDHFEEFGPHSRFKHLVLKAYFQGWLRKLGLRPGAGPTLCYVDACAGRGVDEMGNAGSPVIAALAAADASRQMTAMRGTAPSISVIAIEKHEDHYALLSKNLSFHMPAAEALLGELREHLPTLEARFGDTPTLYFIDPFGLAPLQADVVRRALAGPKNEVLLLFADQAALRHFGAAIAKESKVARAHRERLEAAPLTLFPELEIADAAARAPIVASSQKALDVTKERAIEILNTAFGSAAWRAEVEGISGEKRRACFRRLYADFLRTCGASYVLDIPVFNEAGEHVYTLVHATKSEHGYRAMKEAVAWALNNAPLPSEVLDAMRAEMSVSLEPILSMLRERLAGRSVRWAEVRNTRGTFSLKHYVLTATPIPRFQLDELKALLQPFRQPGRTEIYSFPPAN